MLTQTKKTVPPTLVALENWALHTKSFTTKGAAAAFKVTEGSVRTLLANRNRNGRHSPIVPVKNSPGVWQCSVGTKAIDPFLPRPKSTKAETLSKPEKEMIGLVIQLGLSRSAEILREIEKSVDRPFRNPFRG